MKIVVLDGYTLNPGDNPWTPVEQLGQLTVYDRTPIAEIVARIGDADIVLTNKTPLTAETINQAPRLKFISVLATGYNVVDVAAARARDIPVSNVPVYGTDAVAQYVLAVLLFFIHRPDEHDRAVRAGEWKRREDFSFWLRPLQELNGKTLGIVGFGRIGRRTAEMAQALGMNILAHDVQRSAPPSYREFEWADIETLFQRSDVISLHCPQTADNREFVNARLLATMKPSAILINASRGGLVNERDLTDALNSGRLAGACLDVVSVEPIASDNPLLAAKNCIITPHLAWAAVEARRRLMHTTAENIAAFQAGAPIHLVN
ncbi:MAG TPA: D-2-hydroxyacid dehydrogenase [Pirellulaceae bacterium]|nr:D-2-hydroxyacid dehydrogenase [Pirellulaceae bacterium]